MRKLFLTVVMALVATVASAQLSAKSELLRESAPESYGEIREYAVNKWDDNNRMIVYEINTQVESFLNIAKMFKNGQIPEDIMGPALKKWKEGSTYNWRMVEYEIENQLENADY